MAEIKIPFNDKLIDLSQSPVVKIVQSNGNFQLQIQVGLKKPSRSGGRGRNLSETTRNANLDANIFFSGKAAVALKKIKASDPASKLTFVMDAVIDTKVPHTGMTFSEFNLKAMPEIAE